MTHTDLDADLDGTWCRVTYGYILEVVALLLAVAAAEAAGDTPEQDAAQRTARMLLDAAFGHELACRLHCGGTPPTREVAGTLLQEVSAFVEALALTPTTSCIVRYDLHPGVPTAADDHAHPPFSDILSMTPEPPDEVPV